MKTYEIPGWGKLELANLVLDYNGTIAIDGNLIDGVRDRLIEIADEIAVHVVTADTFGSVRREVGDRFTVHVLSSNDHRKEKADYVRGLGANSLVAVGNGRNDAQMLKEAKLGIVVVQAEGVAVESLTQADILVTNILDALDLLLNPKRLIATLRC